jgi:hypothetical protein
MVVFFEFGLARSHVETTAVSPIPKKFPTLAIDQNHLPWRGLSDEVCDANRCTCRVQRFITDNCQYHLRLPPFRLSIFLSFSMAPPRVILSPPFGALLNPDRAFGPIDPNAIGERTVQANFPLALLGQMEIGERFGRFQNLANDRLRQVKGARIIR